MLPNLSCKRASNDIPLGRNLAEAKDISMSDLEMKRRQKKRLYIIVGALFVWAVLLLFWFFGFGTRLPRLANTLISHPWAIMAFVVVVTGLFWIFFLRQAGNRNRSRGLVILKACSDVLLIILFAGLLLWNWSSTTLIIVGLAVVVSYVARFIRAGITLATHDGTH